MGNVADVATKRLAERTDGCRLAENGTIYEEEIRYCWIDEDGARVSPVHKDFGKALSWVADWPESWARLNQLQSQLSDAVSERWRQLDAEKIQRARARLTRTGKPPRVLRRLVLRTTTETIAEHERETVDHVLGTIGIDSF